MWHECVFNWCGSWDGAVWQICSVGGLRRTNAVIRVVDKKDVIIGLGIITAFDGKKLSVIHKIIKNLNMSEVIIT
jgi:hypothetical protein